MEDYIYYSKHKEEFKNLDPGAQSRVMAQALVDNHAPTEAIKIAKSVIEKLKEADSNTL